MHPTYLVPLQPERFRETGFLIEGDDLKYLPGRERSYKEIADPLHGFWLDAWSIAERNKGVIFDCITHFPEYEFAHFLSNFKTNTHKKIAYYITANFFGDDNLDGFVKKTLKPSLEMLYNELGLELPGWLSQFNCKNIRSVREELVTEMHGYDNMRAEAEVVRKQYVASINKRSAEKLGLFLDAHPSITKIFGFIRNPKQHSFSWMGELTSTLRSQVGCRTYIHHHEKRRIPIILFLSDKKGGDNNDMLSFAESNGLQFHGDYRVTNETIMPVNFESAFERFRLWLRLHEHRNRSVTNELLAWLHEDEGCPINDYPGFLIIHSMAKKFGYDMDIVPDKNKVEANLFIRYAKNQANSAGSQKLHGKYTFEERLNDGELTYSLWMRGLEGLLKPIPEPLSEDKHLQLSYIESCNEMIEMTYYSSKRNEKKPDSESTSPSNLDSLSHVIAEEIEKIRKNYTLSLIDLLPALEGVLSAADISTAIKKYLDIIRISQEAVEKFLKRELGLFNPIVGENSCQIRAALFAELLANPHIDEIVLATQKRLFEHFIQVKGLLDKIPRAEGQIAAFKTFMGSFTFEMMQEIAIIVSSYILTEAKVVEYRPNKLDIPSFYETLSPEAFAKQKKISLAFSKALTRAAQIKLSELSVIYVQRIALRLLFSDEEKLAAALTLNHAVKDKFHRKIVPFYPAMRLLLNELCQRNVPLVIRIKQFINKESKKYGKLTLVFESQDKTNYSLSRHPEKAVGNYGVFFQAKSVTDKTQSIGDLAKAFMTDPVERWIFRASASHPQLEYPESLLCDPEYQLLIEEAQEKGACYENPSVFMVQHVECKRIK